MCSIINKYVAVMPPLRPPSAPSSSSSLEEALFIALGLLFNALFEAFHYMTWEEFKTMREMETEETSSARVTIGFPLGLALLFILFFFICCFFCCCLHWDKILSLLRSHGFLIYTPQNHSQSQPSSPDLPSSLQKPAFPHVVMKQNEVQSLPVLMPGDEVPRFIAMACPCNPQKHENITIQVQKDDPSRL